MLFVTIKGYRLCARYQRARPIMRYYIGHALNLLGAVACYTLVYLPRGWCAIGCVAIGCMLFATSVAHNVLVCLSL